MTECYRGGEAIGSPESLLREKIMSLWRCFREIFGDAVFGKWLKVLFCRGRVKKVNLWEGLAVVLRALPLIQSSSSVLPLSDRRTSCLSGCGIISA